MRYLSITPEDRQFMLDKIGAKRIEDLFGTIPEQFLLKRPLEIPPAKSEPDILNYFGNLSTKNASTDTHDYFLGAGAYNHFIPTIIDSVLSRSEFYTAYTPYQPEISQGTLQAAFEFQTLICQLTDMEVSNSSLYDGSSSLAEAILMAVRVTGRQKIIVPTNLNPHYRTVLETYTSNLNICIEEIPFSQSGGIDPQHLQQILTDEHAAVITQSPNFFGIIEEVEEISRLCQKKGILSIVSITEALSLGILKPPGQLGADIVVGEAQSLGLPLGFGGPYLGFFSTRDCYKRQMPGRLVGQTVDSMDRRGFVLTLSTREQHIRREKATSNICTNQGLCALAVATFLCTLGKQGMRQIAEHNLKKSFYLQNLLDQSTVFSGPIFNEMVIHCERDPKQINQELLESGLIGGLPLEKYYPEHSKQMLVCVTEKNSMESIELFAEILNNTKAKA